MAEDEIRLRLAAGYLTDPHVSVTVDQYRSQQVFVTCLDETLSLWKPE